MSRDRAVSPRYDRRRAERYWGVERRELKDDFRIVLSAGERPSVNAAYHRWESETLLRALPSRRRLLVLDLACGLGRMSAVLAARGVRVVGADNAYPMLQAARAKLRRARRTRPPAGWVQSVSHELPLADGGLDAVACLGLLEHLPVDLQRGTLREAMRVLRPGGSLYLVLNNKESLLLQAGSDNRHRRARQLANGYYCGLVNRESLLLLLERAGGRVEVLGSNAHYAVLRHAFQGRQLTNSQERELAEEFARAAERDLETPRQGAFGAACADHYFYRATKVSGGRSRSGYARSPRSSSR